MRRRPRPAGLASAIRSPPGRLGVAFVKAAAGRDFTDVAPNKGVYRGKATEAISVRVETRTLEALPSLSSLSWQEQLPELQTPLTAIVGGRNGHTLVNEDDASQQQQQQQQQ